MDVQTEDAWLAERLVKADDRVYAKIQGMYRTPEQYVNSSEVALILIEAVGARKVIELCVTMLESRNQE